MATNLLTVENQKGIVVGGSGLKQSFQIDSTISGDLVAGQYVTLNTAGKLIGASGTTKGIGFVAYNPTKGFGAGEPQVVYMDNVFMTMEAGASIDAGAELEVAANQKVITNAGINAVCGIALTSASADGDIILVQIKQ
jgi:hypothetical protein